METEDKFLNAARRALDEAEKNLDIATLARLRAARRTALDEGRHAAPRRRAAWLIPAGGFAAVAALVIGGLLWFAAPNPSPMQTNMDDFELLAAHENPEFFAELEFYEWLEGGNDAG